MKTEHKIFFAIPYDSLTKKIYDEICVEIKEHFAKRNYKLTTVIGKEQVGPSPEYSEILSFKAQNTDLQKQFLHEIAKSDVVVADLTNNNPNVHLELGVALFFNKNILRVTGRPTKELGFDIQNLEVISYKDKKDLFENIVKYLEIFFEIKKLGFSERYKVLYRKISGPSLLPGREMIIQRDALWFYPIPGFAFRDGAIKLEFNYLENLNPESWFGIYFRVANEIYLGSYLLYIRKNGFVEFGEYNPNLNILFKKQLFNPKDLEVKNDILMEVENNEAEFIINKQKLKVSNLDQQITGYIRIGTYECRAQFENLELINRDTIG